MIYAADLYHDSVVVINPQSGMVIEHFKTGRRPYRILFHPDGKSFFVTSWTDGTLGQYQTDNGALLATVRIGAASHRHGVAARQGGGGRKESRRSSARLFVAAANTNNVYSVGVTESNELRVLETINVAMTPRHPLGMTPSALALSPDGNQLYVVCSDANAVAVVDISQARTDVHGFIPTGWYPTAARALAGDKLAILNGRGLRSYPNPKGPNPTKAPAPRHEGIVAEEYVGKIQTGTVLPAGSRRRAARRLFTTVLANSPYNDMQARYRRHSAGGPVPSKPGERSPIEHVIYIVKENRTYDQVLGDMKEGNGDPSLVLFGEHITPNLHKLARQFVLLDNFYVNSDVSADGHNWSTAAIASDYVAEDVAQQLRRAA